MKLTVGPQQAGKLSVSQDRQTLIVSILREMRGVSEWNLDEDRSRKRISPTPQKPFEGNPRRCFRVFASMFNDLDPSIRHENVAICGGKTTRDPKFIDDARLRHTAYNFPLHTREIDFVSHVHFPTLSQLTLREPAVNSPSQTELSCEGAA